MEYAKHLTTPMQSSLKLLAYGRDNVVDVQVYRSVVGALQYASIT